MENHKKCQLLENEKLWHVHLWWRPACQTFWKTFMIKLFFRNLFLVVQACRSFLMGVFLWTFYATLPCFSKRKMWLWLLSSFFLYFTKFLEGGRMLCFCTLFHGRIYFGCLNHDMPKTGIMLTKSTWNTPCWSIKYCSFSSTRHVVAQDILQFHWLQLSEDLESNKKTLNDIGNKERVHIFQVDW